MYDMKCMAPLTETQQGKQDKARNGICFSNTHERTPSALRLGVQKGAQKNSYEKGRRGPFRNTPETSGIKLHIYPFGPFTRHTAQVEISYAVAYLSPSEFFSRPFKKLVGTLSDYPNILRFPECEHGREEKPKIMGEAQGLLCHSTIMK